MTLAVAKQDAEQLARDYLSGQREVLPSTLISILDEAHPLYQGLGSDAVIRVRGAFMLSMARQPIAEEGLAYLVEELEIPHNAYLIAVAAHCLYSACQPSAKLVDTLLHALRFVQLYDDTFRLTEYGGYGRSQPSTTACTEIFKCLAWLGSEATTALHMLEQLRDRFALSPAKQALDTTISVLERASASPISRAPAKPCCAIKQTATANQPSLQSILPIRFEDQLGEQVQYQDFLCGQPSFVVFFYTRCENELKCPVTIRKLGELQSKLQQLGLEQSIHTAAISYDPAYDTPPRLEQYRRSWGAQAGPQFRMLRCLDEFNLIRDYFQLGVGYGTATVNRHRLEAYVLNSKGEIIHTSSRVQWDVDQMVARLVTELDTNL